MARRTRNNRGFALIFAAVLTAALAITVASVTSTAGVMQQQAAARKWSVIARSLAEQGMSRALAEARAVSTVEGDSDMDRLLDPNLDDTARCPASGCTSTQSPGSPQDNNLPRVAIKTQGSNSYGLWGAGVESFGGQDYRRVNSGTGAYLVRFDDNLDDTATGFDSTTGQNTVPEGGGTDTPNRDRDMHIFVTSVGLAGGTTESTARARHVIRAVVRTLGGKTVRAGSYVDTGTNGDICGAGLSMCRANGGTTMPNCWCGELEIDDANWSSGGPPLPSTCAQCGTNCPPASFRETPGLCTQLAGGPPKPPEYGPTGTNPVIVKRSTYGDLVTSTSGTKGQCLFRVDMAKSIEFSTGYTANVPAVIHLWDSTANAFCASSTGDLPDPDFDFDTWTMAAGTGAKDCWIPVHIQTDIADGCPYDGNSATQSSWVTPDCNISDPGTTAINLTGGGDSCRSNNTLTTSGLGYNWCPGRAFGGNINAMDAITSTGVGGHNNGEIHKIGGNHVKVIASRTVANTPTGIVAASPPTVNGATATSWATLCGCVGCTNTNSDVIDFRGTATVNANGPKGAYLIYQGNGDVTVTATNSADTAYSRTALYFAGNGNVAIAANTFLEGPWNPTGPSKTWALTAKSNCTINTANSSKTGFRKGIWCRGNIVIGQNNGVHVMGDLTAGDAVSVANVSGGKNNNFWCAATGASCPSATACGTQRGTIWSTGNIDISDNGGGTGPDVCMDLRASLNVNVNTTSNNGWVSGTIWVGGNATGPRLQVDPGGSSMMGATPRVLSFQSFAF